MKDSNPFGPVIFSYSRAQAIADGVLVELSQFPVIRDHWTRSFCCTDSVWGIIEEAINSGAALDGVLFDICWVAKAAIGRRNREADTITFRVVIGTRTHNLKLHVGPGDHAEPVLTLMLMHED